jgi:hypothetical protein
MLLEKRVVRKTFLSKGEEIRGNMTKLQSSELRDFYWSPDIMKVV